MEKVIAFIIDNWRLCAECACALVALLLFVLRKKPQKVVDGLYSGLLKVLPGFIVYAEELIGAGKGDVKLNKVIELCVAYINKLYPGITDVSPYIDFVKSQVEILLSTPHKKGE